MNSTPEATRSPRHEFETNGYVLLRSWLPETDLTEVTSECRRLIATAKESETDEAGIPGRVTVQGAVGRSRRLRDLLLCSRAAELFEGLFGHDYSLHFSQVMQRPCSEIDTTPWHRDGPMASDRFLDLGNPPPLMTLRLGIFLSDCSAPSSGELEIVPGSHRSVLEPGDTASGDSMMTRAGDAVVFHNAVLHRVRPNQGDSTLRLYFGVGYPWMRPWDYSVPEPHTISGLSAREARVLGGFPKLTSPYSLP